MMIVPQSLGLTCLIPKAVVLQLSQRMMDLDQAIDQSYREASDAEASARRLEARIERSQARKGCCPVESTNACELQGDPRKSHPG